MRKKMFEPIFQASVFYFVFSLKTVQNVFVEHDLYAQWARASC